MAQRLPPSCTSARFYSHNVIVRVVWQGRAVVLVRAREADGTGHADCIERHHRPQSWKTPVHVLIGVVPTIEQRTRLPKESQI